MTRRRTRRLAATASHQTGQNVMGRDATEDDG